MDHRFDTEGPRLYGVLEEVTLEEPLGGVDVFLGTRDTQTSLTACWVVARDAVDHEQHRLSEFGTIGVPVCFSRRIQLYEVVYGCIINRAVALADRQANLVFEC